MAFYPCDACGQKFIGRSSTVYPAILDGQKRDSSRIRLCADCFADYRQILLDRLPGRAGGIALEGARIDRCDWCREDGRSDGEPLVFVTLYPARGEREDFWGRIHENCVDQVGADMLLRSP